MFRQKVQLKKNVKWFLLMSEYTVEGKSWMQKVKINVFFWQILERVWRRRTKKFSALSMYNSFYYWEMILMISGMNSFFSLETIVIPKGRVHTLNSTRRSRVKLRLINFSWRERMWTEFLLARENHLGYAFCRVVRQLYQIVISWEIKEVRLKTRSVSNTKVSKNVLSPLTGIFPSNDLKR